MNNLLQSRNNIPFGLVNVRKQLCDALNIDHNELPFSGELMQVKTESMQWQPALEKLLRSFALRLLVPDKHYKKVNKFVNNNNLRTRLVYEHITDTPLVQHPEEGTVHEQLEFHPDHKLSKWVEQQIIRQFDYVCLKDEKNIERYDKAITLNALIKSRSRHEKDDREEKNNPANYVMGWNNEKKKEHLIKHRNLLADIITRAGETLEKCKAKAERMKDQFYAINRIQEHKGFAELDVAGIQRSIHKLQEQIKGLRKANKELDNLKAQLQEIQQKKEEAERQSSGLLREETRQEDRLQQYHHQQKVLQPLLQHINEEDKDGLLQFQQQHANLLTTTTLRNIDQLYEQLKFEKTRMLDKQKEEQHREETQLNKCINRIKNPSSELKARFSPEWEGDVQHLPEDAAFANEYIEWLNKLVHDNLPKYKKILRIISMIPLPIKSAD